MATKEMTDNAGATNEDSGAHQEAPVAARKRAKLCQLQLVEAVRIDGGFQLLVSTSFGRRSLSFTAAEADRLFKELETAFHVIRSQM